jgi:hypothetical protein
MRLEFRNNFKNKVKNVYVFLESTQILFISQIQKYFSNKTKHVMILLNHNYKPSHNMNKYKRLNLIHYFKESNKLIKKIIQIIKLFKHLLLELNFNE